MITKKVIIGIAVVVIAVVALGITAIAFLPVSFPGWNSSPKVEFRIEKGDGINTIAGNLSDAGLIRSQLAFKIYAVLDRKDKSLQAGLYMLSTNLSVRNLVDMFSGGGAESEDISVTIPEGSNINDIDLIFAKSGLTKKGDFLSSSTVAKEGYLFPDTYKFLPGTALSDIVKKINDNFYERTDQVFKDSGVPGSAVKNFVVIASLLEKEVQSKEDMSLVTGIIEKRMSLGMMLQIDATTAYGECHKSFVAGAHCETSQVNLIEAIKKDSPYNTYRIAGLPVGPISNPGLKAIQSAIHPTASDYLYYLTDKEGNVHYAKTGTEHNQNKAKYLH